METKKLRRSIKESVIGGVSGGLGEYFDTDPVIFRILFVVLALTGGGGVFIYLLMWIFIPKADKVFETPYEAANDSNTKEETNATKEDPNSKDEKTTQTEGFESPEFSKDEAIKPKSKKNGNLLGGTILIIVGLFFIADDFFPWFNWEYLWPAALIIVGLAIIKINYNKNQKNQ